ncbi:cytochrome P450 4C1-like [Stegodyphus dumicola]|uniref:cytochrome P450 4C1-like n=1 Tax=Stegodyphus dumicola TaxID=202533 RepID=UPI0015B02591|nr:cytochrome P450 4C1-like [Stegodyphus dumicola]
MEPLWMLLMCLIFLGPVLFIFLLTGIHLSLCKSKTAKSYENLPAYGRDKPLLLIWQHYQQISRIVKDGPLAAYFFNISSAFASMFQHEGLFFMWIGFQPYVFIYKPEHIKAVLTSRLADDKSQDYDHLRHIVGTGLATSFSKMNAQRRKLLQPAFHSRILENFIPTFNEHSLVLVSKLKTTVNKPWIDITPMMTACALDILCQTVMGIRINAQEGNKAAVEYTEAAEEIMDLFVHRIVRPWFSSDFVFFSSSAGQRFRKARKSVDDFTGQVIHEKKATLKVDEDNNELDQYSKKGSKSFLELLLEHHAKDPNLTLKDVQDEVDTFMFAGHDTSTILVNWVLYLLGLYPDIQDKVYQEQCSIFGNNKTADVTNEDLKNMVYLENVIKETLRLYPPGPLIGRKCKESIKTGSYTIPAGTNIYLNIYKLHRDPAVFPNPEKFDPERFSPENNTKRDTFSYIPFSAGVRSCIGQRYGMIETRVILSHIIRNLKVISLDPRDMMNVYMKVTLRWPNPLRLRFSLRP